MTKQAPQSETPTPDSARESLAALARQVTAEGEDNLYEFGILLAKRRDGQLHIVSLFNGGTDNRSPAYRRAAAACSWGYTLLSRKADELDKVLRPTLLQSLAEQLLDDVCEERNECDKKGACADAKHD